MWTRLPGADLRRRWLRRRLPPNPLQAYLAAPLPAPRARCRELEFLALDIETSGLDPARDRILSLGTVVIRDLAVHLDSAWYRLVRPGRALTEDNVRIHRITDDQAAAGLPLRLVLPELLEQLAGRVLLAHHAALELGFLNRLCRDWYDAPLLTRVVDTQTLARRRLQRRGQAFRGRDLRLYNLRAELGLPRYRAHHALSDALATAELFLALLPSPEKRLREILA